MNQGQWLEMVVDALRARGVAAPVMLVRDEAVLVGWMMQRAWTVDQAVAMLLDQSAAMGG